MSGYSVQTPRGWIKPRELVDLVKCGPDQVVLEVWFREIDIGSRTFAIRPPSARFRCSFGAVSVGAE